MKGTFKTLLAAGLLLAQGAALAATHVLDYRRDGAAHGRLAAGAVALDDGVVRETRLPAADAPRIDGTLAVGDRLRFAFFDDRTIELELLGRLPSDFGAEAYSAKVVGETDLASAVVIRTSDGLQANIQGLAAGRVFTVSSGAFGVAVREINPNAGVRKPSPSRVPVRKGGVRPRLMKAAVAKAPGKANVDILVAYENGARSWLDGEGSGITNFAQMAVARMNLALANTGLDSSFRFRLAGVVSVPVKESDLDRAIDAALDGDGAWNCVAKAREEFGADIVSVLVDTGSAYGDVGLGYSLQGGDGDYSWFADQAYNACAIRSVAQSHTMTHEVGHNMGAGHSERQAIQPGPQLFPYSCGHYFEANGELYHTIMAYNSDGRSGESYAEVPYFSSPAHTFEGVAVGTSSNDNTRTLLATFAQVAAFRDEVRTDDEHVFGPFGDGDDVVIDKVEPTVFAKVALTFDGQPAAVGDCVAAYRKSDGALCGLGKVVEFNGKPILTVSMQMKEGTAVHFKAWRKADGETFDVDDACDLAMPEPGSVVEGLVLTVGGQEAELVWLRSRDAALAAAEASGRLVLMLSGRETCGNTTGTRDFSCEDPDVKRKLLSGYVVWFNDCDNEWQESWQYSSGLGSYTLPLVCVIDPLNPGRYLARTTGYQSPADLLAFLNGAEEIERYAIDYDLSGGENAEANPRSYAAGDLPFTLNAPTRKGYRFAGWLFGGKIVTAIPEGTTGDIVLVATWEALPPPPENDDFADAKAISGESGAVTGTSVDATSENGEPLLEFSSSATKTVWWKWVAPASGSVQFDTIGTSFDTVMGVYVGSSLAFLDVVAEDDDGGGEGYASSCVFDCVGGTTYYICVGGYGAEAGAVKLNWTSRLVPASGTYVIRFNVNASSGCAGKMSDLIASFGEMVTLPDNQFVRAGGYEFVGWGCSSWLQKVDFADGAQVLNLAAADGEVVDLYAVWQSVGETDLTVRTETVDGYNWKYRIVNGGAELYSETWYDSDVVPKPSGKVVVPDRLGGCPVTAIGRCALSDCPDLTEIVLPATVKIIGFFAFCHCDQLTSVSLPDGLQSIGEGAFADCASLTGFCVPKGCFCISDECGSCSAAFSGCSSIQAYEVASGNEWFAVRDGILYDHDFSTLIVCPVSKSRVDVPNSVTRIYGTAFEGCESLTELTLPDGLTEIGRYAFENSGIRHLTVPGSVKTLRDTALCGNFRTITLSEGVENLFGMTFYSDGELAEVRLPQSLRQIDGEAFFHCTSLKSIIIPVGVTNLQGSVFAGCTSLESVFFEGNSPSNDGSLYGDASSWEGCASPDVVTYVRRGSTGWGVDVGSPCALWPNVSGCESRPIRYWDYPSSACTVTYDPGERGIGAVAIDEKIPGVALTLKGAIFTRGDYLCQAGWSLDPDGTTYDFALGESYEADAPITLYPFWSFGVWHFDANGGTGTMLDAPMDPPWLFPGNGFVREGHEFLGWSLDSRAKMPDAPEGAAPDPMGLSGTVTLYAVWRKIPGGGIDQDSLWPDDEAVGLAAANTYNAFVWDGECVVGYAQVKTAKGSRNKTTGEMTASVTATVTDAAGKKWSYSKGKVGADGAVGGLVCSKKGAEALAVSVGAEGVTGFWGEFAVSGARNGFAAKGGDAAAALAAHFRRSWTLVLGTDDASAPTYLQLNVKAKGAVSVAGRLPDGTKVSASTQLLLDGDGNGWVPVSVVLKKVGSLRLLVRLDAETQTAELVGACRWTLSDGKAVTGEAEFWLDEGGATEPPVPAASGYEPSANNMVGVNFAAQVLVNGLGHPAKFTAKGLPKGLNIDSATGAVTGVPTKAGSFPVTVTVAGTANSKWAKAVIPFTVEIAPLPAWAQGSFTGYATDANDGAELFGAAKLSVSAAGKVSGKATVNGVAWSFAATGYAADSEAADGLLRIAATAKKGKLSRKLALAVTALASPDDLGLLANGRAAGEFGDGRAAFWRTVWSDKATKVAAKLLAAEWKGVYAVRLPAHGEAFAGGWGYLSLAVSDGGSVKATGRLADGTAVSLTAPLCFGDGREAFVILCASPSAYKGGSVFLPLGFAEDRSVAEVPEFGTLWTSLNPQATGDYGAGGFRTGFAGVEGRWHDRLEALGDRYDALTFALGETPTLGYTYKCTDYDDSGRKTTMAWQEFAAAADTLGQPGNLVMFDAKGRLVVAKKTKPVKDKASGEYLYDGANDGALTLSYNAATGVFKGSYTLWYDYESAFDGTKGKSTFAHKSKKINFEGIVVEGLEPSGFYLWSRSASYTDAKGKAKAYTWKESRPVWLEPWE